MIVSFWRVHRLTAMEDLTRYSWMLKWRRCLLDRLHERTSKTNSMWLSSSAIRKPRNVMHNDSRIMTAIVSDFSCSLLLKKFSFLLHFTWIFFRQILMLLFDKCMRPPQGKRIDESEQKSLASQRFFYRFVFLSMCYVPACFSIRWKPSKVKVCLSIMECISWTIFRRNQMKLDLTICMLLNNDNEWLSDHIRDGIEIEHAGVNVLVNILSFPSKRIHAVVYITIKCWCLYCDAE